MAGDFERQRNLEAMASAADKAGSFTRIVEQLQKQEQTVLEIRWDGCGVGALQKGDVATVRRVGSHEMHRGDILLYRTANGLRFGRILRVTVEQDGRYLELLNENQPDQRVRLKSASIAGKIVEARRGNRKVSLSWSFIEDLKQRFLTGKPAPGGE